MLLSPKTERDRFVQLVYSNRHRSNNKKSSLCSHVNILRILATNFFFVSHSQWQMSERSTKASQKRTENQIKPKNNNRKKAPKWIGTKMNKIEKTRIQSSKLVFFLVQMYCFINYFIFIINLSNKYYLFMVLNLCVMNKTGVYN